MNTKLRAFIDWYSSCKFDGLKSFDTESYLKGVREATNLLTNHTQRNYIGASSLGKPTIMLALKKLNLPKVDSVFTTKTMTIFHYGHVFEVFLINLLVERGLIISDQQLSLKHEVYTDYKGHIDFILEGTTLVEVKTMSNDYFKSFTKEPNNYRGYYTQLAFYWYGLLYQGYQLDNCGWLCFNKETAEIAFVEPDHYALEDFYNNILIKLVELDEVSCLEDLVKLQLPTLRPEVYKKEPTGRYFPNRSFRYSPYHDCFYNFYSELNNYGKEATFIDISNPPDAETIVSRLKDKVAELS